MIKYLSKFISSSPDASCGRALAILFALYALALATYCVFIRGNMAPPEERLIEFFSGFAVSSYGGAKLGEAINTRIN